MPYVNPEILRTVILTIRSKSRASRAPWGLLLSVSAVIATEPKTEATLYEIAYIVSVETAYSNSEHANTESINTVKYLITKIYC